MHVQQHNGISLTNMQNLSTDVQNTVKLRFQ